MSLQTWSFLYEETKNDCHPFSYGVKKMSYLCIIIGIRSLRPFLDFLRVDVRMTVTLVVRSIRMMEIVGCSEYHLGGEPLLAFLSLVCLLGCLLDRVAILLLGCQDGVELSRASICNLKKKSENSSFEAPTIVWSEHSVSYFSYTSSIKFHRDLPVDKRIFIFFPSYTFFFFTSDSYTFYYSRYNLYPII